MVGPNKNTPCNSLTWEVYWGIKAASRGAKERKDCGQESMIFIGATPHAQRDMQLEGQRCLLGSYTGRILSLGPSKAGCKDTWLFWSHI